MSSQYYGILPLTSLEADRLRERIMTKIHEADTILFVGAGASVPFGYQTTDQFITEVKNMPLQPSEREIFDFYAGTPNITIEDIIRALDLRIKESKNPLLRQEALSPLRTIQVPFSSVEDTELKSKLESESTKLAGKLEERLDVYKNLKDMIISQLYIAYGDRPELEKAWEVYEGYIHILREQNGDTIPIFTTNYDKTIESLENIIHSNINQVVRGFKGQRKGIPRNPIWSAEEVFDRDPKGDGLLLFKLHGSLNWRMDHHHQIREAEEGLFELRGFWKENVLVPPGTVDFLYGEPYQSLRTYLEGYLQQAQRCVVIGYRFDDPTIRDIFVRSLERGLRLIMLNPEAETIKADKFSQFENITCIPKTIEDGVEDTKEAFRPKEDVSEPSEAPLAEPEAESPSTSTPETA